MSRRSVGIGLQDFQEVIEGGCFYIDKTHFIKEWWESKDKVTLITRPRRFGKTLNMSMLEKFFSVEYANRGDLFKGLSIWEHEEYQKIQGTHPVIFLSFSMVKPSDFETLRQLICQLIKQLYDKYDFLLEDDLLSEGEKQYVNSISADMKDYQAFFSLYNLSNYLSRYYGKKVILLIDEYDTPMQEAYVSGFWEETVSFMRGLFNATFKTNPYIERGLMTGITRISKESVFSDLNHLRVVTTTSEVYETSFGFTEREVFDAMDEMGIDSGEQENVKFWYDGFTFGKTEDIYNPWSIINYLKERKLQAYWANTSSNGLISELIRRGDKDVKLKFEDLLKGKSIRCELDEQVVFNQLNQAEGAIWSLLLASGYLKIVKVWDQGAAAMTANLVCDLALTNHEILVMFHGMVRNWFGPANFEYNQFTKYLLAGDIESAEEYLNRVLVSVISHFDSADGKSPNEPERFYHGLMIGLSVSLLGRYSVTSNRESGFGRYDVLLEPLNNIDPAIIMEFKVYSQRKEKTLEDTAAAALQQIEDRRYEQTLLDKGISKDRIAKYGFAFRGKEVLIVRA